jgi:hypothetical protein
MLCTVPMFWAATKFGELLIYYESIMNEESNWASLICSIPLPYNTSIKSAHLFVSNGTPTQFLYIHLNFIKKENIIYLWYLIMAIKYLY